MDGLIFAGRRRCAGKWAGAAVLENGSKYTDQYLDVDTQRRLKSKLFQPVHLEEHCGHTAKAAQYTNLTIRELAVRNTPKLLIDDTSSVSLAASQRRNRFSTKLLYRFVAGSGISISFSRLYWGLGPFFKLFFTFLGEKYGTRQRRRKKNKNYTRQQKRNLQDGYRLLVMQRECTKHAHGAVRQGIDDEARGVDIFYHQATWRFTSIW